MEEPSQPPSIALPIDRKLSVLHSNRCSTDITDKLDEVYDAFMDRYYQYMARSAGDHRWEFYQRFIAKLTAKKHKRPRFWTTKITAWRRRILAKSFGASRGREFLRVMTIDSTIKAYVIVDRSLFDSKDRDAVYSEYMKKLWMFVYPNLFKKLSDCYVGTYISFFQGCMNVCIS